MGNARRLETTADQRVERSGVPVDIHELGVEVAPWSVYRVEVEFAVSTANNEVRWRGPAGMTVGRVRVEAPAGMLVEHAVIRTGWDGGLLVPQLAQFEESGEPTVLRTGSWCEYLLVA